MADLAPIGLYVHWPYCARICPYCDFNVYKNKPENTAALTNAILSDMRSWRDMSGPRRLDSIHFGGGTPSLMPANDMAAIIKLAQNLWSPAADLEIALEANPNDITDEKLTAWRGAAIERLSIGVQSFDDEALEFLGRDHNGAQAKTALEAAANIMPRVSADFIFGLAGADDGAARLSSDLTAAIDLGIGHISAYQLTIEERTAFAKAQARGEARSCSDEVSADLFELAGELLGGAGFERYEVSNFAKTKADQARHNLLYWHGEDYAGIGPGAHGRLTIKGQRSATIAAKTPSGYTQTVQSDGRGIAEQHILSPQERAEEYVLMGLRLSSGISLARLSAIYPGALNERAASLYTRQGLLESDSGYLRATEDGRLVLDRLCAEILAY